MKFHRSAICIFFLCTAATILHATAQTDDYVELQFVSYPPVAYSSVPPSKTPVTPAASNTPATKEGAAVEEPFIESDALLVKKDFVELMISPEESLKVDLPTGMLSKVYRVKRLSHWVLGKPGIGPDGKPAFTAYGTVAAASASRQIILVVPKGKTYAEGLRVAALDGSTNGFKAGQYLLINLSTTEVAGSIGDTKYRLNSGGHKSITPKASEIKHGISVLHVYSYYRKDDKAKTIHTTEWVLDDKARFFVFFYNDPRSQKVRMYHFRDYPHVHKGD